MSTNNQSFTSAPNNDGSIIRLAQVHEADESDHFTGDEPTW